VKAHLLGTLARALQPGRILEIGGGLGYSAPWLARGAPAASIETIDRFPEHVALIREHATRFGLADRIRPIEGEAEAVLPALEPPYDFIHDDGWFGRQPPYLERMLALLRPGGTLAISNWFLIEQAVVSEPFMDWAQFAGPNWKQDIRAYAETLCSRTGLDISFISRPWLALAVKRA
jgi:predicted O-methyltransferase YrrM